MKGITIFEQLTHIREDYIRDAELDPRYLAASASQRKKTRGTSAFSRFINSGWGVAAVCTLVAVSVMGGIIWAGNRPEGPGEQPPVGQPPVSGETETAGLTFTTEAGSSADTYSQTEAPTEPETDAESSIVNNTNQVWYIKYEEEFLSATANDLKEAMGEGVFVIGPGMAVTDIEGSIILRSTTEDKVGNAGYILKRTESEVIIRASSARGAQSAVERLLAGTTVFREGVCTLVFNDGFLPVGSDITEVINLEDETEAEVEVETEIKTEAESETTDNLDSSYDTLAPEQDTLDGDFSVPVEPETDENGMILFGEIPEGWPVFSLSAEAVMGMEEIEWADDVTVRRDAVYTEVWATGGQHMNYVMEMREVTDAEGVTTLHLILRDPADGNEVASYEKTVNEGQWGILQFEDGIFVLYDASYEADKDILRLKWETLVWTRMDLMSGEDQDFISAEVFLVAQEAVFRISHGGRNGQSMTKWNGFLAELHSGYLSRPRVRVVADGLFGDFAFFGDEEMTTTGWERFLDLRVCALSVLEENGNT